MFGKVRSERSFSLCLAEELLRAELRDRFGNHTKFFTCNIVATHAVEKKPGGRTMTDLEVDPSRSGCIQERTVKISALFGPMERRYPDSTHNMSCQLYRVDASCRLFSIESGCIIWHPHYLRYAVTANERSEGSRNYRVRIYENGYVDGARSAILTPDAKDNPCLDMVTSQPRSNKPQDWTPRIDD